METVAVGLVSCLSAAVLYAVGETCEWEEGVLKSVTRVKEIKDLAELLNSASKALPLLVTVSGKVGSEAPINCKYSGLRGVIVEQRTACHFLERKDIRFGNARISWTQDSELVSSARNEVPWYLDDGTDRVHVVGARSASGLVLPAEWEVFEEPSKVANNGHQGIKISVGAKRIELVLPASTPLTIVDKDHGSDHRVHVARARSASGSILPAKEVVIEKSSKVTNESERHEANGDLDCRECIKIFLGVKRIERVLPIGTHLTVVGEVVKNKVGSVCIRKPRDGPFYVSDSTIDQLIDNSKFWASFCKFVSKGCTMFGVFLLVMQTIEYIIAE
ncbi:hypothetical protein CDL12_09158 [Handroanthus impetiginosus]|uniref:RING-type E3 ubiquitin transferase n=1 Tax=Handroanthus impetiginosus TaxID=429701 RepID=A0A2G9HLL0_9LAMI|nr:hypothetical protein CDL12_09158 [Handroanthus impetiginosus]